MPSIKLVFFVTILTLTVIYTWPDSIKYFFPIYLIFYDTQGLSLRVDRLHWGGDITWVIVYKSRQARKQNNCLVLEMRGMNFLKDYLIRRQVKITFTFLLNLIIFVISTWHGLCSNYITKEAKIIARIVVFLKFLRFLNVEHSSSHYINM